jgi:predicted nuclease with TOPRIM domain
MEDIPWVTIIVAFIGLVSALAVARSTNRKYVSEGADAISQAAVRLVQPLQERLDVYIEENLHLRDRLEALETEARELETMRFENQHLKERVKYLELQVEVMKQSSQYDGDLAEAVAEDKLTLMKLTETVEALSQQVIELGGWPVNKTEE